MKTEHMLAAIRANEAQLDVVDRYCLAYCERVLAEGDEFTYDQVLWMEMLHERVTAND